MIDEEREDSRSKRNNKRLQKKERQGIYKVRPCHDSEFKGIDCLESEDKYGFFRSDNDVRPGNAIWVKKEDIERLFEVFKNAQSKA